MIAFALLAVVLAVVVAWLVVSYLRAGVEAVDDGIDPDQPTHHGAGHV